MDDLGFVPDPKGGGNDLGFVADAPANGSVLKQNGTSGESISARTPGLNERLVGLLQSNPVTRNIPQNLTSGVTALENIFMKPPSMVDKLPDSGSKAVLEQMTGANIAMGAGAGPVISALKETVLGKALLAGILAKFGVTGAQEAGTEFGTASGIPKEKPVVARAKEEGLGDMVKSLTNPQKVMDVVSRVTSGGLVDADRVSGEGDDERNYHNVRGVISAASALPAAFAGKIGEGLMSKADSGVPASSIKSNLEDIGFTPDIITHAKEGDATRKETQVEATGTPPAAVSGGVKPEVGRPGMEMFSGVGVPKFIGKQEDFSGKTKGFNLYNLTEDIKDGEGKVLHSKGSTVSENTLKKYGIEVPVAEGGEKPKGLGSGVTTSEVDWEDLKKKVGLGKEDWTHQGVKIAMTDSGFKSTDTEVDAGQLKNRVINKLNPESSEAKMWKGLGIDEKFKQGEKSSPEKLAKWMTENGPRVEVRKFGQGTLTPVQQEAMTFRHNWYDSLPQESQSLANSYANNNTALHKDLAYKHLQRFAKAEGVTEPKAQELLNEWTRLRDVKGTFDSSHWQSIAPKSEKDMPGYVEIAVVKSGKKTEYNQRGFHTTVLEQEQFPSSHSFPPNTLGFVRGYMETDKSTREKTFHVIEVQSDWAQAARDQKVADVNRPLKALEPKYQDVLLPHYERLAFKAAIDHARKESASHIAISDAETAMMTEGHDRAVAHGESEITQEQGMRLHYDRTLPKIAEELTGEKGKRVEFGEHRMARGEFDTLRGNPDEPNSLRKDLIFRNPDSTPKTSVSARSFPITKPSERLSSGEPLTQMGKLYSGVELPKPVQDAIAEAGKYLGLGGFTPIDKLPKKAPAVNPKTPTKLEGSLSKAEGTTPIESRDVSRNQPGEKMSFFEKLSSYINDKINLAAKADKLLLPVDAIFDRMDGSKGEYNGWLFKNIRKPIDEKFNYELQLRDSMLSPVTDLAKKLGLADTQSAERLGVYAQAQQKGGRERMIKSGITESTINKIVSSFSDKEKRVYATMRTMMDQSLPAVQSVMKELYGKDVKPIENYFPMPRDYQVYKDEPTAEIKGEFNDHMLWRLLEGDYEPQGAKTEQGFTIQRKPGAKTAIKVNGYEIYQQHIRDVAHLLAMQKTLHEIGQTVRKPLFAEKYGDVGQELTLDWLNTIARQGKAGKQIRFLDIIRNNTSKGIIGFRLASQLVHTANVPLAWQRAGIINWHKGLGEAMLTEKGEQFLHDHFEETFERGGGEPSLVEASRNPKGGWVFAVQRLIDRANAQATVLGVYMSELEKKGLNPEGYAELPFDRDAGAKAMVLARRAVASPLYKDLPPALARGGSLGKMFFQFQNTFLDQWSNIRHDLVTAGIAKKQPEYAARLAIALAAMMVIEVGIKQGVKNAVLVGTGNEPEGSDKFIHHLETDALRRVPGMGQLMSAVLYGETGVPTADVAIDAVRGGVETATGKRIQGYPNAKPSDLTRIQGAVRSAASVAELTGVPGASQSSEIIQDLMKKKSGGKKQKKQRHSIVP